ncbi:MAG: tetratricopeptide repeat protein, partial [Parvularculaceae bacterium]|nr:tetratricopeptide repeat protein [Parvularculaceae bacterium]
LLVRTNDAPRAKEVLEKSLAAHPGDVENLKLLAATQLMQQDWRGAEASAKAIEAANAADPAVGRILGAAYTGLQDFSGVIRTLGDENQKAPLSGQPLATLVDAYLKGGRAADAEALLRGMIAKNPRAYDATILLAQTLDVQKKSAEIEPLLRAAYAMDKNRPEAVENLYRLLRRENRDAELAPFLDAIIAEAPENFGARYVKGDLLIATGQKEAAIAVYGDILSKRPNDLIAANNYASLITEVRTDAESFARALTQAKKLADTPNPFFLDTLGWAQFKTGDVAGARATLARAVSLVEGFAEGHYHLAEVYAASGDKALAEAEARKALEALAKAPNPDVERRVRALLERK